MGEQFGAKVPGMPRARLNERADPLKSGPASELDPQQQDNRTAGGPQSAPPASPARALGRLAEGG